MCKTYALKYNESNLKKAKINIQVYLTGTDKMYLRY